MDGVEGGEGGKETDGAGAGCKDSLGFITWLCVRVWHVLLLRLFSVYSCRQVFPPIQPFFFVLP